MPIDKSLNTSAIVLSTSAKLPNVRKKDSLNFNEIDILLAVLYFYILLLNPKLEIVTVTIVRLSPDWKRGGK